MTAAMIANCIGTCCIVWLTIWLERRRAARICLEHQQQHHRSQSTYEALVDVRLKITGEKPEYTKKAWRS